jgi:hypothetical protein
VETLSDMIRSLWTTAMHTLSGTAQAAPSGDSRISGEPAMVEHHEVPQDRQQQEPRERMWVWFVGPLVVMVLIVGFIFIFLRDDTAGASEYPNPLSSTEQISRAT